MYSYSKHFVRLSFFFEIKSDGMVSKKELSCQITSELGKTLDIKQALKTLYTLLYLTLLHISIFFVTTPFGLGPHVFWLIAGESESGVCLFCDLVCFCQSFIRYHVRDQGRMPKHVMDVCEGK